MILDLDENRPIQTRQPSADLGWIIMWAALPMGIQEFTTRYFGYHWSPLLMLVAYSAVHALFVISVVDRVVSLGKKHGTFMQESFGEILLFLDLIQTF